MRYAVAQRRGRVLSIKVLDPRMKIIVETEGYECISMSSRPPYGPHIRHHGARIWGMYNADLKSVKVISKDIDKELEKIETSIENLKKEHRLLLAGNWRKFSPATSRDFNPKSIVKAKTRKEAEKEMPDKNERKKLATRGKRMGAMLNSITNKVFRG
ncbi:hypothetical protein ES708_15734 [subsurface metagenome]